MQAGSIKKMEQTGKSKSNTNNTHVIKSGNKVNCHMIQLPDLAKQKKTSLYQAQDSESHCDHADDDPSDNANALAPRPGTKRKRAAQLHKLSEKRRRDKKINRRLRALQDLIPNCTKMDKASVLDDAIQYLKSLQYQLQIMSVFAGLPTQMMLPTFYPPNLQGFTLPFLGSGTTPSMMSIVTRFSQ